MTWQTAHPACINRSLNDSSPVTNGTLSGVSDVSVDIVSNNWEEGVRSAQSTDRQINPMAAQTTAGFGGRDPGCDVVDLV